MTQPRRRTTARIHDSNKEILNPVNSESIPQNVNHRSVLKHHKAISIQDLHFPPGLKHHNKSLLDLDSNVEIDGVGDIESRLMGLPGSLQLDSKKNNKYFGMKAREEFFSRYHWLNRQRKITIKSGEEDMDRLYFECAKSPIDQDNPFAPVRPKSAPTIRRTGNTHASHDHLIEPSPKSFSDRLARLMDANRTIQQELSESTLQIQEDSLELSEIVETFEAEATVVQAEPKSLPEVVVAKVINPTKSIAEEGMKQNVPEGGQDEYTQTIQRIVSENNLTTMFKSKISGIDNSATRQIIFSTEKVKNDDEDENLAADKEQVKAPQQFQKRVTIKSDMKVIYDFMYSQKTAKSQRALRQLQTSQLNNPVDPSVEDSEDQNEHHELSAFEKRRQYHANAMQFLKKRREEFVAVRRTERPKSAPSARSHVTVGEPKAIVKRTHDIGYVVERVAQNSSTNPIFSTAEAALAFTEKENLLTKKEEYFENATASMDDISSYAEGSMVTESTVSTTALLWKNSGYRTLGPLRPLDSLSPDDQKLDSGSDDDNGDMYINIEDDAAAPISFKQEKVTSSSKLSGLKNNESCSTHSMFKTDKKEHTQSHGKSPVDYSFQSAHSQDQDSVDKPNALVNISAANYSNSNIISREFRSTADPKQRRLNIMKFHNDKMKTTESTDEEGIELSRGGIESPRTKFLVGCIEKNLNPRAALVLRKNLTKRLDLQHHGIGDGMAALLAESLKSLPFIQAINIADNRLTDDGMGPILQAAVQIPGLLELNMSQNVIGPVSAACLFEYLISPTCPLERLILKSADVDDFECENFVKAIRENRSLIELDLSSNLIGKAENLNTVMPELTTGAEALADLLRMPECKIKTLRLDWNMIRLDGAIDLANSIASNQTLTFLDLSYNSLATGGGITLGVSLLENTTLETLILQNNNLDSVACITICAGIIENRGLKKVYLDGNPIGDQGVRAVMLVPLLSGNRVKVSATGCNISIKDANCWFNFDKLPRDYALDMTDGFSRAVAIILLHLIAGHPTFLFNNIQYDVGKGKKVVPIDLVQDTSTEFTEFFDTRQNSKLKYLMKAKEAASDMQSCIAAFHEVDYKGEGKLDRDTVGDLLDQLGIHITDRRLDDLFAEFDTDDNGGIDLKEYLNFVKTLKLEAEARVRDLTDIPIMALKGEKGQRYIPPFTGSLNFTVFDGFARKPLFRIMTECDHHYIAEAVEGTGSNSVDMMVATLEMVKIRIDEALIIVDSLLRDIPDKVKVLRKVVLAIHNFRDAYGLISIILGDELNLHLRLKKELGLCYRVIMGNLNGYYILDLAVQIDRICLERLIELSATYGYERQLRSKIAFGRIGDVSQKGNWSCFRNEFYEGNPMTLNGSFLSPLPGKGKLEFDFSGSGRPRTDVVVMSDMNVVRAFLKHHVLKKKDVGPALQQLQVMKSLTDQALTCAGNTAYETSLERSTQISEFIDAFYANLGTRRLSLEETKNVKEKCDILSFKNELLDMFERDRSQVYPANINQFALLDGGDSNAAGGTGTALLVEEAAGSSATTGASGSAGGRKAGSRKSTIRNSMIGRKPTRATMIGSKNRDSMMSSSPSFGAGAGGSSSTALDDMTQLLKKGYTEIRGNDASETDSEEEDGSGSASHNASTTMKKDESASAAPPPKGSEDKDKDADAYPEEETEAQRQWKREEQMLDDAMKFTAKCKQRWEMNNKHKKRTVHTNRRRNILVGDENYLRQPGDSIEFFIRLKEGLESQSQITIGGKAQRLIDLFEDCFGRIWIYCRHLALLLQCFLPYGFVKQTKHFGTYRVELVISLFARLVDLHNFELVLAALSPFEVACVYCRLGWLNIYNPCKPEGSWELDISRREERVIAKILCTLAVNEVGDNWQYYSFRWTRTMEPMPGWELTQPWLTEEGMPTRGLLTVTYYGGEGKQKKNCKPYVAFRKSLLNLVLANEEAVVREELRSKPADVKLSGEKAFERHKTVWESYLGPPSAKEKAAADAKAKDNDKDKKGKGKGKKGRKK